MRHCPTCERPLTKYPAKPAGYWHCQWCGTLEHGDDPRPVIPEHIVRIRQYHAECMRDDRHQCAIYILAAKLGDGVQNDA